MMWFSSTKLSWIISLVASHLYFYIIITQIPLFRFPCRIGVCRTPIEITTCQLIASEISPEIVVKGLLYPGAIRKSFAHGTAIPGHDQLHKSFKSKMRKVHATTDLNHLEVLVGSYLCVAGSLLGMMKPGRMSLFGLCLIIWGFGRETFVGKHMTNGYPALSMHPNMAFALLLALCSAKRDVKKLIKSFKPKRVAKQLKNHSNVKYK